MAEHPILMNSPTMSQFATRLDYLEARDEYHTKRVAELEGQLAHALANTERAIGQTAEAIEAAHALKACNAELQAMLQDAAEKLDEAADDIQDWGAYASEYLQEKHDLTGTVRQTRQHAARFEAIAKGGTPAVDNAGGQEGDAA